MAPQALGRIKLQKNWKENYNKIMQCIESEAYIKLQKNWKVEYFVQLTHRTIASSIKLQKNWKKSAAEAVKEVLSHEG